MDDEPEFLRINEQRDVLCSLELCSKTLESVETNSAMWKWVLISLHSALQGSMVCHLSGTAQLGALCYRGRGSQPSNFQKTLAYLNAREEKEYPEPFLATPLDLLKRLESEQERLEAAGSILNISAAEKEAFRKLNELRKKFIHFDPSGWSIQIKGYVDTISLDVISLLQKIRSDGYAFRHLEESELDRIDDALNAIRGNLRAL